jgi:hypothetical protein
MGYGLFSSYERGVAKRHCLKNGIAFFNPQTTIEETILSSGLEDYFKARQET